MEKINQQKLLESWTPVINKVTNNAVSPDRMGWIAQLAHNQQMSLNEAAVGGVSAPYATLNNTLGVGNAVPASMAGMTAADQTAPAAVGSGDKWHSLLPVAIQVAARTIGFDLVNVTTLDGPTGVLPFMDYVYADSKAPYGATPARDAATANPKTPWRGVEGKDKAYKEYDNLSIFKVKLDGEWTGDASVVTRRDFEKFLRDASVITLGGSDATVEFVSRSRIGGDLIFKVLETAKSLGEIFESGSAAVKAEPKAGTALTFNVKGISRVSMLEDQILGYAGSGRYDSDKWSGTFQDPFHLYEPMDRATGETQIPRRLSLTVDTKFIQVGKIQVAVNVTREQVTDLQKQWGIDVLKMVENAAINELTQTINKHILSRLFALGWRNHLKAYAAEGVNLNLSLDTTIGADATIGFATYEDGQSIEVADAQMPIPAMNNYGDFENLDTRYARVAKLVKTAGNIIMQRGRRGPATFVVCNSKVASMLQDQSQYTFAPLANTFNQNNGQLYPLGTLAGMTVYVDPMMRYDDTRILVGRKGDKDEPGLHFCPYLMAESVNFINPMTMAPQLVISSRYALVDVGWYPETQYLTLFVNTPENMY